MLALNYYLTGISQGSPQNGTDRMCVYICMHVHAHTHTRNSLYIICNWLMRSWKLMSPDFPRVSWRAGDPGQLSRWHISSLQAGRLETQKKLMFQFDSEGRKKPRQSGRGIFRFTLFCCSFMCLVLLASKQLEGRSCKSYLLAYHP